MSSRDNIRFPQINYFAGTSRWLGILSISPYLILGMAFALSRGINLNLSELELPLLIICAFWGVLLGLPGFITGVVAIWQLKTNQIIARGIGSAVTGIVLSSLGVMVNLLLWYFFLSLAYID